MVAPDPDAYDAVMRWGRTALAWEVLRRDPAYRIDQSVVAASHADAAFVARWGLHFR